MSSTVARLRHFATVLGLIPSSRLSCASEACDHSGQPSDRWRAGPHYCCSDSLRGRGAAMANLSHRVSFHSKERIAPSKRGIKQLGSYKFPDSVRDDHAVLERLAVNLSSFCAKRAKQISQDGSFLEKILPVDCSTALEIEPMAAEPATASLQQIRRGSKDDDHRLIGLLQFQ